MLHLVTSFNSVFKQVGTMLSQSMERIPHTIYPWPHAFICWRVGGKPRCMGGTSSITALFSCRPLGWCIIFMVTWLYDILWYGLVSSSLSLSFRIWCCVCGTKMPIFNEASISCRISKINQTGAFSNWQPFALFSKILRHHLIFWGSDCQIWSPYSLSQDGVASNTLTLFPYPKLDMI